MNYWEIGYAIFACITFFLIFGTLVQFRPEKTSGWLFLFALVFVGGPAALFWPLTLTLSMASVLAKNGRKA